MKFKEYNPKNNDIRTIYHLMISGIAPRPIALVGSYDKSNNYNLAPFSFFNGFGANPPIIGFSPALSGRTGLPKDTLLNIEQTKEFTISVVTSNMVEQTSLASSEYDSNVDEFIKAGFTKYDSKLVKVPGVGESPFIMECKLHSIVPLGGKPASGNLILGEIVYFHIDKKIIADNNRIDPFKIDQVGRSGGSWYSEIKKSLFSLEKPSGIGVGFDNIPDVFLHSSLTGNQLAQLASVPEIPTFENSKKQLTDLDKALDEIANYLKKNNISEAWQIILNWKYYNE